MLWLHYFLSLFSKHFDKLDLSGYFICFCSHIYIIPFILSLNLHLRCLSRKCTHARMNSHTRPLKGQSTTARVCVTLTGRGQSLKGMTDGVYFILLYLCVYWQGVFTILPMTQQHQDQMLSSTLPLLSGSLLCKTSYDLCKRKSEPTLDGFQQPYF